MTRDDSTATQPENPDEVDLLVSRRVDGEVSPLDIPEHLRDDVESRAGVVSAVRAQLRATADMIPIRESQILSALTASRTQRRTGRRVYGGRPAIAVAASFVFLAAASLIAVRQFDSDRDDALTEGITATAGGLRATGSPADISTTQEQPSPSDVAGSGGEIESSPASAAESRVIPEFSTREDIDAFIASMPLIDSKSASSDIESTGATCDEESTRAHLVRLVSLQGRLVEVQMFDSGGYAVYDVEDCSLVFERTSDDASAPPG